MKPTYSTIWNSALRIIKIRSHSVSEIENKLKYKFPDEYGIVLEVINEMKRVCLLNDESFTEDFVHYLIQKPIGRMKIMIETRKKGLDEDLVDQMLENENWSEKESLKKALEKKERTLNEDDPRKKKMKLANFLKSRGFRGDVIFRALNL